MQKGWIDEQTFNFFVPAQAVIVKGGEGGADKTGKRWIQGIASTDARDLQGEVVNQQGIDFSYFLKHGFFNDDHKPGPEHKLGEPTEVKLTKNGLWVKGFLFNGAHQKKSQEYWDLMKELEASGSNRKVGFSIQGKVVRKNGNTIEKCWIQDIAITTQPVNTTTWAEIAKSLSAQKWDLVKETDEKKKKEEEAEKALTVSATPSGGSLVPESLEAKTTNTVTVNKSYTFSETCALIKSHTGFDDETVTLIAKAVFELANGVSKE